VYKTRDSLESQIYPVARIIKDFTSSSTELFVDDARFFNYEEDASATIIESVGGLIVYDTGYSTGSMTATINTTTGRVTGLTIVNAGSGYTGVSTTVSITSPRNIGVGIGTTATATVTITNGRLTTPITITNPGLGYTIAPKVLVPTPAPLKERVRNISVIEGFAGIVTGITTTSGTGGHPLALKLNLKITSGDFSSLQVGYPIYVTETNVGRGVTSVDSGDASPVGVGTTFLNNIYYVHSITRFATNAEIITNIRSNSNITGITTSGSFVGRFSWGKLSPLVRGSVAIGVSVSGLRVDSGLSTFPSIERRDYGLRSTGSLRKLLD